MDISRLTRTSHRQAAPSVPLLGQFPLAGARAHEFCGRARRRLALWTARQTQGQVLWIRPAWAPDRLHMAGLRAEIDPARLLIAEVKREKDLLWCLEEALRSGAVALAVAEVIEPPALTPVRRLHLAAEQGAEISQTAPLGLVLTPGTGGAAGVESRWQLEPNHGWREARAQASGVGVTQTSWRLIRRRARNAPEAEWSVLWRRREPVLSRQTPADQREPEPA